MKSYSVLSIAFLALAPCVVLAQENSAPAAAEVKLTEPEAAFQKAMEKVAFTGKWMPVDGNVVGEARDDSYAVQGVEKQSDGRWKIRAMMKYGGKEVEIPIPTRVEWAGDTAVLVVEKLAMPGSKEKYSARVLVHNGTYAGTWSSETQGGLLAGVLEKR
jgi:hypothetical protein